MPETQNQETEYAFTNKSGFSAEGPKIKLSFESSTTKKVKIKEFSVCQNGEGNKFLRWRYFNTKFDKDERYLKSWTTPVLADLPDLSKNKLKLSAEAIYRLDPDFNGKIKLLLGVHSKGVYHQVKPGTVDTQFLETKIGSMTKEVVVDFSQIKY